MFPSSEGWLQPPGTYPVCPHSTEEPNEKGNQRTGFYFEFRERSWTEHRTKTHERNFEEHFLI